MSFTEFWNEFWERHDPDNVFAYSTMKVVKIRDRWLGLFHLAALLGITFYIVGIVIISRKGYLENGTPVGTVRTSLRMPFNTTIVADDYPYCQDPSPYPSMDPCEIWDDNDLLFPHAEESAMTATTRVAQTVETRDPKCVENNAKCKDSQTYTEESKRWYYLAGVESYTMRVEHSMLVPQFYFQDPSGAYAGAGVNMAGKMMRKGKVMSQDTVPSPSRDTKSPAYSMLYLSPSSLARKSRRALVIRVARRERAPFDLYPIHAERTDCSERSCPANQFSLYFVQSGEVYLNFVAGEPDQFTIQDLLNAAGVSLDDNSTSPTSDPGETWRHSGIVIEVIISYSNLNTFFGTTSRPEYTYYVSQVPDTEFKVVQPLYENRTSPSGTRIVYDRHGIRVVFTQSGSLGRFSMVSLLINFASGLALLKLATIVVDTLAIYVMKHKKAYRYYKYQYTADFSDLRDDNIANDIEKLKAYERTHDLDDEDYYKRREMKNRKSSARERPVNRESYGLDINLLSDDEDARR